MESFLRVGLIGCGGISRGHVRNLLSSGQVKIVGLADPSAKNTAAMQHEFLELAPVPAYLTPEELLDAQQLDGVVIMSPHALHFRQVMLALDHNLHVLSEKPLAVASDEARQIAERAKSGNRVVMVNYQRRLDPAYARLRTAIVDGELGELQTINMLWGQGWASGTSGSWRQVPSLAGGGMLYDSGSHMLDMLLWLAGSPPRSVMALVDNRGTPVDINSAATIRFANGLVGQIMSNGDAPLTWIETTVVTGTRGVMRFEFEPQYPWRPGRLFWYRGGEVTQPALPPQLASIDNAWVQCILGRHPNPAPPEAGVLVADLTAAIYRSAQEGAIVELEPAAS